MTVEHDCNSGTEQPDELSASNDDATQIHATSQPNPDPPDRNYEGIIAVITAITNEMKQQFHNDLFPTTWAQQSEYDFNDIYIFTTANRYPVKVSIFSFWC